MNIVVEISFVRVLGKKKFALISYDIFPKSARAAVLGERMTSEQWLRSNPTVFIQREFLSRLQISCFLLFSLHTHVPGDFDVPLWHIISAIVCHHSRTSWGVLRFAINRPSFHHSPTLRHVLGCCGLWSPERSPLHHAPTPPQVSRYQIPDCVGI